MKPAASPPRNPGRLRKPPGWAAGVAGRAAFGGPGWVMLRSIGRAVLGAVVVVGGAVKVFVPRLPVLTRERASASTATTASAATMAQSASSRRKRNIRMDGLPEARLGSIRPYNR